MIVGMKKEIVKQLGGLARKVSCGILCLLLLYSCAPSDPEANNFDNVGFVTNLKTDALSPIGEKAAFYGGRIYYLSSELGTQGIYSMDAAGKDVTLEIPAEDIRSINVRDDGIYYAGFAGIRENEVGPFRDFHLYIQKHNETSIADFLRDVGYPEPNSRYDGSVWDFYVSDQGVIVICFAEVGSYRLIQLRDVVSFQNGQAVAASEYEVLNQNIAFHYTGLNQRRLEVGRLG